MKVSVLVIVALAAVASFAVGLASASSSTHTIARARVGTATSSLGRIVVDAKGRTLYLFEKDTRGHSNCSGQCATYWPPLLTRGKPTAVRDAKASLLGTIRRAGGNTQVTYAGHPLYRFVQDSRPGQTTGEGSQAFGAGWDVLSPAGKKIEKSQAASPYPR